MKKSYIFLSDSFEDIEAIAVIDILRRAGAPIVTVSMNETLEVTTSHHVTILADILFDKSAITEAEFLILPGGSARLNDYDELKSLIVEHAKSGGRLAAICAAPMVLGGLGLLSGKRATCFPGFESYLKGATLIEAPVVVDDTITTANGAGAALEFGYTIVEQICGKEKADTLRSQMQYK